MAQFLISAFADEASNKLEGQIKALTRNGIAYLEPRNIEGGILTKTDEELAEIRRTLDAHGIGISSLGSPIGKYDITKDFDAHLKDFRRALEICRILGTTRIRMFSFFVAQDALGEYREEVLRRLSVLLKEAKAAGITLCHENESAIYGQNPEEVEDLLTSLPEMKGIFDAANYVMNDQDPIRGIEATLPSLAYLHIKDASRAEKCILPAGAGDGEYREVLRRVDAATDGTVFLTLEPHLHIFDVYKKIDKHTLRVGVEFENSDDAFDYAATSLKNLLTELGYHEEENHLWKK